MVLRIVARCLTVCGVLGEGLSSDPPQSGRYESRWQEIDRVAERHPHATVVAAEPVTP
jgi:hypothetical protein